jgi:hypothetical protein
MLVRMNMNNIKNPIANRILTCLLNGHQEQVHIALGMPYADLDAFVCEYEIVIGETINTHKIMGIDGIQALQLALFMVGSTLGSLPGASEWKWNDEPNTGFPTDFRPLP